MAVQAGPAAGRLVLSPLAAAAAALTALGAVTVLDPARVVLVPCPLFELTGLACPFCGAIRAVHALAHGEVAAAAGHNVAVLAAVPVVAVLWVCWVARRAGGTPAPFAVVPGRVSALAGLVLLAFAVVRNLPVGAPLAP